MNDDIIYGLSEISLYLSNMGENDFAETIENACKKLELLKEQEPAHIQRREFAHMWFWCCGSCGVAITEGDKFCRMCGKAVKWDEGVYR